MRKSAIIDEETTLLAQVHLCAGRHYFMLHTHARAHKKTAVLCNHLLTRVVQISHDMRQPIHALKMLNDCLEDTLARHAKRVDASQDLLSAHSDSLQMRDVLAHLMSLADDFLIFSCMQAKNAFSLKLLSNKLGDVTDQVERVCRTLAKEKGNTFMVEFVGQNLSAMLVVLVL
jgi:signal transduction histidine kinase